MKKLLYTLVLLCTIFISACETNKVSKISEGVKVVGKCCKELSGKNLKSGKVQKDEDDNHNVSYILPAYFWDTKNMIR